MPSFENTIGVRNIPHSHDETSRQHMQEKKTEIHEWCTYYSPEDIAVVYYVS